MRRSLKWRVTYRISAPTIPDSCWFRHGNKAMWYSMNIYSLSFLKCLEVINNNSNNNNSNNSQLYLTRVTRDTSTE